ncbi:hypothetical protein [Paenibacillus etheri]|uniref:Uncharacterized protein n=1 Tax=Paenibacillus etheri TaxID=1306852 RepID=A0A0W1B432_9BACL|nr:hypothetical protein [Paenibacillus etheri]KTD88315.1 hypothetical protein UQ64_05885 [Paenibacillus etheri]
MLFSHLSILSDTRDNILGKVVHILAVILQRSPKLHPYRPEGVKGEKEGYKSPRYRPEGAKGEKEGYKSPRYRPEGAKGEKEGYKSPRYRPEGAKGEKRGINPPNIAEKVVRNA